jgi:hypothetical protein
MLSTFFLLFLPINKTTNSSLCRIFSSVRLESLVQLQIVNAMK